MAGGGADKGDFGGLKVAESPNTKKENVWYLRVTTRYYRHRTEIQNTSPRIEPVLTSLTLHPVIPPVTPSRYL